MRRFAKCCQGHPPLRRSEHSEHRSRGKPGKPELVDHAVQRWRSPMPAIVREINFIVGATKLWTGPSLALPRRSVRAKTNRRRPTAPVMRTTPTTPPSRPIRAVRARTRAPVLGNRLDDERLRLRRIAIGTGIRVQVCRRRRTKRPMMPPKREQRGNEGACNDCHAKDDATAFGLKSLAAEFTVRCIVSHPPSTNATT